VNVVVPLQTAVSPPVSQEQTSEVVVDVPVTTELGRVLLEQATSSAMHITDTLCAFMARRVFACARLARGPAGLVTRADGQPVWPQPARCPPFALDPPTCLKSGAAARVQTGRRARSGSRRDVRAAAIRGTLAEGRVPTRIPNRSHRCGHPQWIESRMPLCKSKP
jgi:hypothetical protein